MVSASPARHRIKLPWPVSSICAGVSLDKEEWTGDLRKLGRPTEGALDYQQRSWARVRINVMSAWLDACVAAGMVERGRVQELFLAEALFAVALERCLSASVVRRRCASTNYEHEGEDLEYLGAPQGHFHRGLTGADELEVLIYSDSPFSYRLRRLEVSSAAT